MGYQKFQFFKQKAARRAAFLLSVEQSWQLGRANFQLDLVVNFANPGLLRPEDFGLFPCPVGLFERISRIK